MAKKKSQPKPGKTVPFESALQQLQQIVSQLENGNLTLTESLEKYELGINNLKRCYQALEQAEKKIELLVDLDGDGNLITQPFDDRATDGPARKTTRQADVVERNDEDSGWESEEDANEGETDDIDDPHSLF